MDKALADYSSRAGRVSGAGRQRIELSPEMGLTLAGGG